jgi:uncharacterized membrane protein YgcG
MRLLGAVLAAWSLLAPAAAAAEERILLFHSAVQVQPDGRLLVTETIRVRAEGREIKRGIYRDLPTLYKARPDAPAGLWAHRTPLKVLGVKRNGEDEAWHTVGLDNGLRIYIGQSKVLLDPGVHTYELTYRYDRILKHLAADDELFWNVTGNGWSFAMDTVTAEVTLPGDPGQALRLEAYTGPQGAQGRHYHAEDLGGGRARFTTTRELGKREGLSVVVGFPKGLAAQPTKQQRWAWALADNRDPLLALLGAALVWGLLTLAWSRHGVDPPARPIVPRFYPPKDLPAAALRWLDYGAADATGLLATLLGMGVKGRLKLSQDAKGKAWTLERTAGDAEGPLERAADLLFSPFRTSVRTDQAGDLPHFRRALKAHSAALGAEHRADIKMNLERLLPALGVGLLFVLLLGLSAPLSPPVVFVGFFALLASAAAGGCLAKARDAWRPGREQGAEVKGSLALAVFALVFCVPIFLGLGLGLQAWWQGIYCLVAGSGLGFFVVWMPRPSVEHRRLKDEIEGFALYLGKAEAPRIKAMSPPERTPELFERYLPYALALGVVDRWTGHFEKVLAKAAASGAYRPGWVHTSSLGRGMNAAAFHSLGRDLGSGLSRQISSASTPPASSGSGGGGGGSSGGGGGGGGGGGW